MHKRIQCFSFSFFGLISVALFVLFLSPTAHADVNNFVITDYAIGYHLSKDADGRSVLKTKETITARFPDANQNHGIERAIPKKYDGHPTHPKITSVTDENGNKLQYSTHGDGSNEIVRIGNPKEYAYGKHTYVITYIQKDVTKYFPDTDNDEFYWDTNGTDWKVPIRNLTVTLTMDDDVRSAFTDQVMCYVGAQGSTNQCDILAQGGNTFSTTASNLRRGETVTIAFGFTPDTFAAYQATLGDTLRKWWGYAQSVLVFFALIFGLILHIILSRKANRESEQKMFVTEYIPPKNASVSVSANIIGKRDKVFPAQLIDLAVRHYIKIIEVKPKRFLFLPAQYAIEIEQPLETLRPEEKEVLTDLYDKTDIAVGERFEMKKMKHNPIMFQRIKDNKDKVKKLVQGKYALRVQSPKMQSWLMRIIIISLIGAVIFLSPVLVVLALFVYYRRRQTWILNDEGLALARYLKGLKEYIKVAEADRLQMLQSPEGAEKTGINANDEEQMIVLYEKVLPYAVLFKQEKEWSKALGRYYESTGIQPMWYVGSSGAVFSASSFSSALGSFSTMTSSSAGGTGAGGFAGGGGGGGGGGGW